MISIGRQARTRQAFTLTEVALSILVLAVAVLTVALLIPGAAKDHELNRFRMYSSMIAVDLSDRQAHPLRRPAPLDWFHMHPRFTSGDDNKWNYKGFSDFYLRQSDVFSRTGEPDLENLAVNALGGYYPVPTEIALRFENEDIKRILRRGGQLYYPDPMMSGVGAFARKRTINDTEGNAGNELQKIVFAIDGYAQQNALGAHPLNPVPAMLYPFPPQIDANEIRAWYETTPQTKYYLHNPEKGAADDSRSGGFHDDGDAHWVAYVHKDSPLTTMKMVSPGNGTRYQGRYWTYKAWLDQEGRNKDKVKLGPEESPWIGSLPEMRRLVYYHWARLVAQISDVGGHKKRPFDLWDINSPPSPLPDGWVHDSSPYIGPITTVKRANPGDPDGGKKTIYVDGMDRPLPTPPEIVEPRYSGYTMPPNGLPTDRRHRGSDIEFEDVETCLHRIRWQVRTGIPSLERRVQYRTAALALWARVNAIHTHGLPVPNDGKLLAVRPTDLAGAEIDTIEEDMWIDPDRTAGLDPNVMDHAFLNGGPSSTNHRQWNPMLAVLDPPANPHEIHPLQVLALSYLAHAAIMVTGYEPPFFKEQKWEYDSKEDDHGLRVFNWYDDENGDRQKNLRFDNMTKDETAPYKLLTGQKFYLYEPDRVSRDWKPLRFGFDYSQDPNDNAIDEDIRNIIKKELDWKPMRDLKDAIIANSKANGGFDITKSSGDAALDAQLKEFADTNLVWTWNETENAYLPYTRHRFYGSNVMIKDNKVPTPNGKEGDTPGIMNPYPPPYANRGRFDWTGVRYFEYDLSDTSVGDFPDEHGWKDGLDEIRLRLTATSDARGQTLATTSHDTTWARNVQETALRWAIAYTNAHPHDRIVPKVLNNQHMMQRPLYAFDLFDKGGNAQREWNADTKPVYPVTWAPNTDDDEVIIFHSGFGYGTDRHLEQYKKGPADQDYHQADGGSWPRDGHIYGNSIRRKLEKYDMRFNGHSSTKTCTNFPPAVRGMLMGRLAADVSEGRTPMSRQGISLDRLHYESSGPLHPERFWYHRHFTPAERTRQLVFWAVDWKSYADAESAPSAPVDFSQVPLENTNEFGIASSIHDDRSWLGNPERFHVWLSPKRRRTYSSVQDSTWRQARKWEKDEKWNILYSWDPGGKGDELRAPWIRLGHFGADRNGNGKWDKGPIPKDVRMRPTEIARYVFYDPIAWTTIDN